MAPASPDAKSSRMTYRFLGNSGLLVSKLSLGSWMEVSDKYTAEAWYEMMKLAFENGGVAEGTWSREDLVITTKIFFGAQDFTTKAGPNAQGLSRNHIIEGTKAALKRLDQEYVDVLLCHRPEPLTPIEDMKA
ncbi:hypothetical protein PR003_g23196 [Phytophthora rubi]|uniref:NADP-dependent oxidoreductase domain-containing protein n=1 Tax=Phytophthora rubi TaxID=129364 RepID=A0A6A4D3I6_9STRA|nr:hypothetical protein PR003_g23196 [Phytophthora rubi]